MSETATGGCQCGAVCYRIAGGIGAVYACHCRECQKQSASAFGISVPVMLNNLTIIGDLQSWGRATASGSVTECYFCAICGTRIFHAGRNRPGMVTVKGGTLDDTAALEPIAHIWNSSKQPWLDLPGDVAQWKEQPRDLAQWATLLTGSKQND